MFFRKKQFHPLILSALLCQVVATSMGPNLNAQPVELQVQKSIPLVEQNAPMRQSWPMTEKRGIPTRDSRIVMDRMILPKAILSTRRMLVECSPEFEKRNIAMMKRRFSELFERDIEIAGHPSDLLYSTFLKRVQFGTSGIIENEGFWKAHLQRTDFEIMAGRLSLNDINRYQFRKNRRNGDTLPSIPAGGILSPKIEK